MYMVLEQFDTFTRIYIYVVAMTFGMCMGSFLNCCAYRYCHDLSIFKGRSKCDYCDHVLGPLDLIPIFSYLFSGGKCRYCGAKLNIRYLVSEVISGLAYVLVIKRFGLTIETIKYIILVSLMLLASFADLEDFVIPEICIVLGIINRIVFIFLSNNFQSELLNSIIGALCITVPLIILVIVMEKILKKDAMGGGDIKLVFMLGSYLSFAEGLFSMLVASFVGILFAVISNKKDEQFPFGPSLCLGYFISILYGSSIISWYLSLF